MTVTAHINIDTPAGRRFDFCSINVFITVIFIYYDLKMQ